MSDYKELFDQIAQDEKILEDIDRETGEIEALLAELRAADKKSTDAQFNRLVAGLEAAFKAVNKRLDIITTKIDKIPTSRGIFR